MRGCGCIVYAYYKDKLIKASATACWSMLAYPSYFHVELRNDTSNSWFMNREIYIADFDDPLTEKHQQTLVSIVNEITPCKIVEIPQEDGDVLKRHTKFIQFRTLNTYDQNLVVLNFVRNLWYEPLSFYKKKYCQRFFEFLEAAYNTDSDPLSKLTWANKMALEDVGHVAGYVGHSNVHGHKELKIRTAAQLKTFSGLSTRLFLTSME